MERNLKSRNQQQRKNLVASLSQESTKDISERNPQAPPLPPLPPVSLDKVSHSLYTRYSEERDQNAQQLEFFQKRQMEVEERMKEALNRKVHLEGLILEQDSKLDDATKSIERNKSMIEFYERRLNSQKDAEQAEKDTEANITAEVDHVLKFSTSELLSIDHRNRAFESKLNAASDELQDLRRIVKTLQEGIISSRESQEVQMNQLEEDIQDLQKGIMTVESEREQLSESRSSLETYLSAVKSEMISLGQQLERTEQAKQKVSNVEASNFPVGEVSVVFCDIEDAVGLWEHLSEVMIIAVEIYHKILRDQLALTNGYEVKSEAEVFMAAFSSPLDCLKWCHLVQEALLMASWPDKLLAVDKCQERLSPDGRIIFRGMRVRMGFHTGNPEVKKHPHTGRVDYFGPDVNKCARIAGLAHGGQILVSESLGRRFSEMNELNTGYKITPLGRYTLRGVGEDETIYQTMPRTLSDRAFEKGLNDSVNIQEKLSLVKRKEEEEAFTITAQPEQRGGITKEMSELVAQIEFALKDQDASVIEIEENPLSKRKKELLSEYVRIGNDISAVKERINYLKKEKSVNLRREKVLKEDLIGTMEQKILLEDRVRSFVKDRVEKEMTIEKTYANIQSLVDNQTDLQQSLSDIRRNKVSLNRRIKYLESDTHVEAKILPIRDRMISLENELRRTEMFKELRGKHLRSLERLISIVNGTNQMNDRPSATLIPEDADEEFKQKKNRPSLLESRVGSLATLPGRPQDEEDEEPDAVEEAVQNLQIQFEQAKKEKEMYSIQASILEDYFKKMDDLMLEKIPPTFASDAWIENDPALTAREVGDLQEERKIRQHQIAVVRTERDSFHKQLSELKENIEKEMERKLKALERIKEQVDWAQRLQVYWKELIIREYQEVPLDIPPTTLPIVVRARTRTNSKPQPPQTGVDHNSLLKLQVSVQRQMVLGLKVFDMTEHLHHLSKILQGEKVDILDNLELPPGPTPHTKVTVSASESFSSHSSRVNTSLLHSVQYFPPLPSHPPLVHSPESEEWEPRRKNDSMNGAMKILGQKLNYSRK